MQESIARNDLTRIGRLEYRKRSVADFIQIVLRRLLSFARVKGDIMKMLRSSTVVLAIALISSACGAGKLTTNRAQNTLNKWMSGRSGSVEVLGVQEFPQQNNAKADLRFTNLPVKDAIWGRADTYSGSGTAIFTHYSDGRWVLTEIDIPLPDFRRGGKISTWK